MDLRKGVAGAALALPLLMAVPSLSASASGPPILLAAGGSGAPGLGGAFSAMLPAAARYLGLSMAALQRDMRAGESLAKIASGEKKSLNGLEAALTTALKQAIQQEVKAKRLTSGQASTQEKQAAATVARFVQDTGPRGFGALGGGRGGSLAALQPAAASYLGLSAAKLQQYMRSGQSLAEIASSEKKSLAGLESVLTTALRQAIQKEAASKQLTSAQAKAQERQAAATVQRFVERKGFGQRPAGGPSGTGG